MLAPSDDCFSIGDVGTMLQNGFAPARCQTAGMDVTSGDLNAPVYRSGQRGGHYESWYLRANHPDRPLAFWLRYTIFAPDGRPADAVGELWAVAFDGTARAHAVGKVRRPLAECDFAGFPLRVGEAELGADRLAGRAGAVSWELGYDGDEPPLLLLPPRLYGGGFPKAKSLVPRPLVTFTGRYAIDGQPIEVDGWRGSQNHNWGSRHTARYAFGQVAGFDDSPGSFLELATAKATLAGPLTTPWATTLVLRHEGREYSFVGLRQALRARGEYRPFTWEFATGDRDVRISGRIHAEADAFVGLRYDDPPGGVKHCLNTKIATAEVTLEVEGRRVELRTAHRALFEILTDDPGHGIALRA